MKKRARIPIFIAALALYAALMAVMWHIGTRQAREKTEWQLDYAVIDVHDTVAGAIDTMLGHVARTAVRHIGTPHPLSQESMAAVAAELDIDEINVVTREGVIIASNDRSCMDVVMAGHPVMDEFMALTNGVTATVSQPFRPHAKNPAFRAKYLAAAFPGGNGFVQVGLDERRLTRMLPSILGYIFDEWLLGRTGFFLCADCETGELISNPSRHRDEADSLSAAGYDSASGAPYEFTANGKNLGETFEQTLFGEKCYCRAFKFGGHMFVAALPEHEFYDTRTAFVSIFGVLLFIVLGAFALLIDRVLRYSARLKSVYAAEEKRRGKELSIAKTIQTSALPAPMPDGSSFRLAADMKTARQVGGDFYDYFPVDSTHVAFIVADVSGKGISAALYMMTAKTLIKDALLSSGGDLARAFDSANAELCSSNTASMFLTAWAGVLDLETGEVSFVNAGHNPPVKIGAAGGVLVREKSGPVLAFSASVRYKTRRLRLAPGETLFLYTDGVTEAADPDGALFGEDRLLEALGAVREPDPRPLCTVTLAAVSAFAGAAPQADDITVLAVRYLAPPNIASRSFPPTREGVAAASAFLDESLAKAGGAFASLSAPLHVMLDEICSNIVNYSGASGFEVDIEYTSGPDAVSMTFIDDGAAFDPLAHADPDTSLPASERGIGGLGVMLVRKTADSVSYRRSHNRNMFTVVKKTRA